MSILVALLGNTILAVVGIIDKFILTKSVSKPVIFVFYSTIFILPFFIFLPFGVIMLPTIWTDYLIFVLSGGCFTLGLWTMYTAIEKSEISRVGPLIGAVAPLFILFLSRIFLAEQLSSYALLGAAFLMSGSLLISFEKQSAAPVWRNGLGWGVVAGFLFAVSHVAAKYTYNQYGFYSGFVLAKLPIGVFGVMLLLHPDVRALFSKKPKEIKDKKTKKNILFLVAGDIALGVTGTVLIQYAIALGSVSLVNAMAGVQYAMLIILVAVLSKFFPKIIKEKFTKQAILYKMTSVLIIGIGLLLLLL